MKVLIVFSSILSLSLAAPAEIPVRPRARAATPIVTIASPQATIVGVAGGVESFLGVPFAKPPVGQLRLRPPQVLTAPLGMIQAKANPKACPQFVFSTEVNDAIPTSALGQILNTPIFQQVLNVNEDCLYLNVYRPAGTTPSSKLPVLFWIFGGGFEIGWNGMYDGTGWVSSSVTRGQPTIMVTVNYRVGGFGFLPGAEVLADGSANLGLLDQRLGLQWVADNIAAFGGDPTKVTIWGESAGAISVFDQMALYDGDHTYKGKPLFRGAIMNSGSVVPADPVDCPKGQKVYDTVVKTAGCSSVNDTLACLRAAPYSVLLNAMNSVPGLLSYSSVALSYLPRPDGVVLTQSPDALALAGKFAKVPFIIGDQEDEGTIFALFQSTITTIPQLVSYIQSYFFHGATTSQIQALVATYPDVILDGSPFRTLGLNNWYPQFMRLAAILGDLTFTLTRRVFLDIANSVHPTVPSWSYLSSYNYGTPVLGTFHGSDILQVFFGLPPNYASSAFRSYYTNFVYNLDPNVGTSVANWPRWSTGKKLLNMLPLSSGLIGDDFRSDTFSWIQQNIGLLRI
ncbi:Acetylcholinesterase [Drechslerella dactyloides]|uniref:Carboxylic ester hydrolase n=1 Tax=Drechslerella dactyloides TaxID=74499 RepID=A0AAD6IT57_DREDA|nr:Acetylcholinesterase [Drechslerella dactyloides]